MDSQLKQRIVGAIVLISLAVIFIPMVFNNTGVFQESITASSHIPASPQKPAMQTIITLEPTGVPEQHEVTVPTTARQIASRSEQITVSKINNLATKPAQTVNKKIAKLTENKVSPDATANLTKPNAHKAIAAANAWVVQVASFNNEANAKHLVEQLRKQGITAFTQKGNTKKGAMVRVYAGPVVKHDKAIGLQTQLEKVARLKGKVVAYEPAATL